MTRPASTFAAVLALLLAGIAADARAAIFVYTQGTNASGTLNGVAFSNAQLIFTQTADTNSIVVASPTSSSVQTLTSSVSISGIGNATFLNPGTLSVSYSASSGSVGTTFFNLLQDGSLLNQVAVNGNWSDRLQNPTPTRGLTGATAGDFKSFATSAGILNISFNVSGGGFSSAPQTSAVPEPSSLALAGIGLASAAAATLRRRAARA